mmetsp:Transcript_93292/g.200215  ORF Transcript_93292/g.200215 Transcript_93292/m.200215 type:complete len:158 (+) Transcript_93292:99-572(+)
MAYNNSMVAASTSPLLPQTCTGTRYSGVPRQLLSAKQQKEIALRQPLQNDYDHIITGEILGDEVRSIAVSIDGKEESVQINGEMGPAVIQLDGRTRNCNLDDGRMKQQKMYGGVWSVKPNDMSKHWREATTSEREVYIIQVAKRQRRVKERFGLTNA